MLILKLRSRTPRVRQLNRALEFSSTKSCLKGWKKRWTLPHVFLALRVTTHTHLQVKGSFGVHGALLLCML